MCLSWYFTTFNPFPSAYSERLCTHQSILVYGHRLTSRSGVLRILCNGKFRQMNVREEQILIISKSMTIGQIHIFHVTDFCVTAESRNRAPCWTLLLSWPCPVSQDISPCVRSMVSLQCLYHLLGVVAQAHNFSTWE